MRSKWAVFAPVLIVVALFAVASGSVSADSLEGSSGLGDGERPWGVELVQPTYEAIDDGVDIIRTDTGETVDYYVFEAEYAPIGRFTSMRVEGTSMEPYFDNNDLLFVIWHPLEVGLEVGLGDVIGAMQPECPATHRVYSVAGDIGYRTWGDNLLVPDRCLVEQRNVLYKVVGISKDFYDEGE
jgi:hypothetical protein